MPFDHAPDIAPRQTTRAHSATLVEEHLGLVNSEARRLARRLPRNMQACELLAAGCVGLMAATQRYDASLGNGFGAFARLKIRAAMLDELRELDVLPRRARTALKRLEAARRAFVGRHGREPTRQELAAVCQLRPATVDQLTVMEGWTHPSPDWSAATSAQPSALEQTMDAQEVARLGEAMRSLGEKHREVLRAYYWENLTFRQIGERFGVTESRVCQMHREAVRTLRGRL